MIFEAGNETSEKIWSDFGAEKSKERSENRVVFVQTAVFEIAKNLSVKNFSQKGAKFFVHVRLLKAVFLQLLMVMRFEFNIVLVLGLVVIGIEGFK